MIADGRETDFSGAGETTFVAGPEDQGSRLDQFLAKQSGLTRSKAQKLIAQGLCSLDGELALQGKTRLNQGQVVGLEEWNDTSAALPEAGALDVLYEDGCLAVLGKPSGLTVHPCPSCPQGTLVNRLLARFPSLGQMDGERPGIVHRLDKDTSGLILIALTEACRLALAEDFAGRRVEKHYLALTRGVPKMEGRSELPIGRHPSLKTRMAHVLEKDGGRPAKTAWKVLYADPEQRFALVDVQIFTGRTHQIRVHLAQAGHPLWGDQVYGPGGADPAPRQMLHAWKLGFEHPESGEALNFCLPPPADFEQTALSLAGRMLPVILTGSPGSGKSLAAQKLAERGLPVWNADAEVARLYEPGQDGWLLLDRFFHGQFIKDQGPVDKALLQQAMAGDENLRREIENLIHPLVYSRMQDFLSRAEQDGHGLAVAEVPLWFESKMSLPEAAVVCVDAPQSVRFERLRARGWDEERIAATESWQWPAAKKAVLADLVLDNSQSLGHFEEELAELVERLRDLSSQRSGTLGEIFRKLWTGQEEDE